MKVRNIVLVAVLAAGASGVSFAGSSDVAVGQGAVAASVQQTAHMALSPAAIASVFAGGATLDVAELSETEMAGTQAGGWGRKSWIRLAAVVGIVACTIATSGACIAL